MLKFEHTEVFNFEGAIRGMRNPMNSWHNSDSGKCENKGYSQDCENCYITDDEVFCIGDNDMKLMRRLVNGGSDHRKFLRQIMVSVDITAPLYWWKEFDTYKVGTVANSCSTMHKITDKKFELSDFSIEWILSESTKILFSYIIGELNYLRDKYKEKNSEYYFHQIIQLLPSSYNQKRTITLNYEVLYNIYHSRRNHKLEEWSIDFIDWISELPYSEEMVKCNI